MMANPAATTKRTNGQRAGIMPSMPRPDWHWAAAPPLQKSRGLMVRGGIMPILTFNKKPEHAAYALFFNKLYETNNFTGSTGDNGLTDTYNVKATFTYRYTEALSFDLSGRYSLQSNIDPQGASLGGSTGDISADKDIYETGIGAPEFSPDGTRQG